MKVNAKHNEIDWKHDGGIPYNYVVFRQIHIFHNLIFPVKMHSNCESMDVFQPTELWKKVIMEKKYEKKKSRIFPW